MEQGQLRRMTAELPLGTDVHSIRRRVEALEHLLEGLIKLPLVGRKVGLDALAGLVPVAGDLFDFLYQSNTKNLKIIRRHLDRHHPATRVIEG